MKPFFISVSLLLLGGMLSLACGETRVHPEGTVPEDRRLQPLTDLNGHFGFCGCSNLLRTASCHCVYALVFIHVYNV